MLVLTRRCGEEIVIGETIRVTVLTMHGGQVRLGIAAPRSVAVDRQEIHERRNLMLDACDRPLTDATSLQERGEQPFLHLDRPEWKARPGRFLGEA
jgi:carbon storage regulator